MSTTKVALTAVALAAALSGCGKKEEAPPSAPPPPTSAVTAPPPEPPKTEAEDPKAYAEGLKYSDQAGNFTPPPAIGIEFENSESPPGVRVTAVLNESSASKAGLMVGDIIVAVGGLPVNDSTSMRESVSPYPSRSHIELTVVRNGTNQAVDIFLP